MNLFGAHARLPSEDLAVWIHAGKLLASRLAAVVVILAVPPIAVRCIGVDGYGVWESINGFNTLGVLVQSVASGTVLWKASEYSARGTGHEVAALFWLCMTLTATTTVGVAVMAWLFYPTLQHWLHIPEAFTEAFGNVLVLSMVISQIAVMTYVLIAIATGFHNAGRAAAIQSLGSITFAIITIAFLDRGFGLYAFPVGMAAGVAVSAALLYRLVYRLCGQLPWSLRFPDWAEARSMGRYAGLLFLSNSTLLTRDALDKVIVAVADSARGAAFLAVSLAITVLLSQATAVLQAPFTAAVGRAYASGHGESVQRLYATFAPWYAALPGVLAVVVCLVRRPLIALWLGRPMQEMETYLAFNLCGITTALAITAAGVGVAKACGSPGIETRYLMFTLLFTVLTKPLLVFHFGGVGAVMASCASTIGGAVCFILILHAQIELPWAATWAATAIHGVTILLGSVGWIWGGMIEPPDSRWLAASYVVVLAAIAATAYAFVIGCGWVIMTRRTGWVR